ncbi:MAG: LysR family transcriptional regulator [Hydrogenothermaceae bacterium]|nr:LysR family transcriptional regulator [Hydrogenothermaceae bacterium]
MEILDYHRLKIFKTVADVRSISKAAQMLFISQPTVTLQIKKLENYLGVTLFKRSKNSIELTEEGKLLYKHAQNILNEYSYIEEDLKELKVSTKNILTVGTSSTIGDFLLPKIIPQFYQLYPNVRLNLFVGNSKEVKEGVLSRVFNLGLIEDNIDSTKLFVKKFYEDEIILTASVDNPIPSSITLNQLQNYQLIMREQGSGTRNVVENSLKVGLKPVMEISSSKAIAKIVQNSNFVSFISKLVVSEMLSCNILKEVKIENINLKRGFFIITQKNIRLSPVENSFYQFLTKDLNNYIKSK